MSLKLNERYPGRFNNPTADYPQGSFKNRTTPTAKDGSYLEKDWANDKEGFFQSLLSEAGIVPNGNVDAVGASQFYDAAKQLFNPGRLVESVLITASGVYTPDPRSKLFFIEWVGGGGGSGVLPSTSSGQTGCVGGGAAGSYGCGWFTSAQIGASQPVTIGLGGAGGNISLGNGQAGGATSMGALFSAPGGNGSPAGVIVATSSSNVALSGSSGGAGLGGSELNLAGDQGGYGIAFTSNTLGGKGGSSPLGVGGQAGGATFTPTSGTGYGTGAGGNSSGVSTALKNGISGRPGAIRIRGYA